jgi:3-deoxy-manno-octulosonate cytidylyltransferase (CMP-KDO synthetase)
MVPARLQSTRLPEKALADIGGLPMVVRVARQALRSQAAQVHVATDSERILQTVRDHGLSAILTRADHVSGSDRLAEAASLLDLPDDEIIVNVQGDEPLIDPALIDAVACELASSPNAQMSTAAHAITNTDEWLNPNVVKVVTDSENRAMYFSRAPIPWLRDGAEQGPSATQMRLPDPAPLRHIGIYGYRAGFLRNFPKLRHAPTESVEALEQLRALWHGHPIVVHVSDRIPAGGVDTQEDLNRVRALLA